MNKYIILKKSIAIVLLCCIRLSGGCTVMFGGIGIYGYLNKDDKTTYKKESFILFMTAMGASLDYLWYTQAQKYQEQGESKSRAYGKGALVTYGVFFVVGMIVLILSGNN